MKGRSSRSAKRRRLQPQQRESVFTQACLCETRCLHQRGTLTAACHIQAPEELLLGLRVCECLSVCACLCVPVCACVCASLSPPRPPRVAANHTSSVSKRGVGGCGVGGCKRLAIELHSAFIR